MDKNQKLGKGEFSPLDGFYWIENSFFEHLKSTKCSTDKEMKHFMEKYKIHFSKCEKKVSHLIKNHLDKGNVYFTLIAVASYETFLELGIPQTDAILLMDECLTKPSRQYIVEGTKKMLDYSENPFQSIVETSKDRENNFFGESFEFDRPLDNEFGYVLHVKKCLFHSTLKVLEKTELQHSLCRMDLGWINAIEPDKHYLQFVRPVTFATGNTCQMWFMKKEKEVIKD